MTEFRYPPNNNSSDDSFTVLPINRGGTNNGSLNVTSGNLLETDGTKVVALPTGTTGQVLTMSGGKATWKDPISASASGIVQLNGQTNGTQSFASNNSGSDFAINSSAGTHTFSLPTASPSARGVLTSQQFSTLSGTVNGLATLSGNLNTVSGNVSTLSGVFVTASGVLRAYTNTVGVNAVASGNASLLSASGYLVSYSNTVGANAVTSGNTALNTASGILRAYTDTVGVNAVTSGNTNLNTASGILRTYTDTSITTFSGFVRNNYVATSGGNQTITGTKTFVTAPRSSGFYNNAGDVYYGTTTGHDLYLQTSGINRFKIEEGGQSIFYTDSSVIGSNEPVVKVVGAGGNTRVGIEAVNPYFQMVKHNGTVASKTSVSGLDSLGYVGFGGYTNSAFQYDKAQIQVVAEQNWNASNQATNMYFLTTQVSGNLTQKLQLTSSGHAIMDTSLSMLPNNEPTFIIRGNNNNTKLQVMGTTPTLECSQFRNTLSAKTATQSLDVLGYVQAGGYDGTNSNSDRARIAFASRANWTTSGQATAINFMTTPQGETTATTKWTVAAGGALESDVTNGGHLALQKPATTLIIAPQTYSAAGTTEGAATAVGLGFVHVTSAGASATGIKFPSSVMIGALVIVFNNTSTNISIYRGTGSQTIDVVGTTQTIGAQTTAMFIGTSSTNWQPLAAM